MTSLPDTTYKATPRHQLIHSSPLCHACPALSCLQDHTVSLNLFQMISLSPFLSSYFFTCRTELLLCALFYKICLEYLVKNHSSIANITQTIPVLVRASWKVFDKKKKVLVPAAWLPFQSTFSYLLCFNYSHFSSVLLTNTSCLEGIHLTTNSHCSLQNPLLIIRSKVGYYQLCYK